MRILLVDLSAVFWRAYHATKDQQVNEAFLITVNTINSRRHGYDHCAICCDHGPYKRKAISPEYKAQRDIPDPIAVGQLRRVKERLEADGLLLWDCEGYESDDLIATACMTLQSGIGDESELAIDILTGDKDLYALITDRVSIVNLSSGETHLEADCVAKLGVAPALVTDLLSLTGDKADNVPGCPGVGSKKAAALLAEFGGLEAVISVSAEKAIGGSAMWVAIASHELQIRMSSQLVKLMVDAPIKIDELFARRDPKPLSEPIDESEFDMPESESIPENDQPLPVQPQAIDIAKSEGERAIEKADTGIIMQFETSLEPRTTGQAWQLAKAIHGSRLFACETPEAALMILMTGREMGIGAMSSMRGFHFIKGKPCMSAQLMSALIIRSGKAEYWELIESTGKSATYATKRIGGRNEQKKNFSVDDAKLAQLVKADSNWVKYPAQMCEARACSALARIVYPDLLMGVYTEGELDD